MAAVRRLAAIAIAALVVPPAACGGREVTLPTPAPSPTVTASPSPTVPSPASPTTPPAGTPGPSPELQLPGDAPTALAEGMDPEELAAQGYGPILPPGASPLSARTVTGPVTQIALAWYRGEDPFARQSGLVVWQRLPGAPPWRAVYAFTERPVAGVLGISLDQADLSGDGLPDLLVREDRGGTGACATWRVVLTRVGGATEAWRHTACDTEVRISRDRLLVREAVYGPDDPHCCPSGFRLRTLAFDGARFVEVRMRTIDVGF
ncbi:MAG: hypothetical protein KatS3mg014_0865 [Actinomycetota bacterium]|nr:MAG: hypothetical protein KatS3mg014_0865 [Actinomycetota bacterium]